MQDFLSMRRKAFYEVIAMFLEVRQVRAGGKNQFAVYEGSSEGGRVRYLASAPWMAVSMPFNLDQVRVLKLTDPEGNPIFTTRYHVLTNAVEEAIPIKYLFTGVQKFSQFEVVGQEGPCGAFYTQANGLLDRKFCLTYQDRTLLGYDISKGRFRAVSIYDGQREVAQMTKPLAVSDNLDVYYIHLLDDYSAIAPLLTFFTIYFDYLNYNHSGEFTKHSAEVSVSYTYGKNNRFYDPDFIRNQFGPEADADFKRRLNAHWEKSAADVKRGFRWVAIFFAACLVVMAVVGGLILLLK